MTQRTPAIGAATRCARAARAVAETCAAATIAARFAPDRHPGPAARPARRPGPRRAAPAPALLPLLGALALAGCGGVKAASEAVEAQSFEAAHLPPALVERQRGRGRALTMFVFTGPPGPAGGLRDGYALRIAAPVPVTPGLDAGG